MTQDKATVTPIGVEFKGQAKAGAPSSQQEPSFQDLVEELCMIQTTSELRDFGGDLDADLKLD